MAEELVTIRCADLKCGVQFGVPRHAYDQARWYPSRWIYCPNGHEQHWAESKQVELQKDNDRLRALCANYEQSIARMNRTISYWQGIAHRKAKT